ncbi:MAG: B12-binding domain-containing radical SAM protein [Candidatus Omnitrophica bacterium]|nr:B12-binding domain-containing radical SAM protein [Candidatus Omnitrophota bacterium]
MNDTRRTKILLVALNPGSLYIYGVRSLSAVLNSQGFDTRILFFFPNQFAWDNDKAISNFIQFCVNFDLIGFSFTSYNFFLAVKLAEAIKRNSPDKIILFGGADPTAEPQRSLKVADAVCVGEGEVALPAFVKALEEGKAKPSVPGLWLKDQKENLNQPLQPLVRDFSRIPTVDNNFQRHFVLHRGNILNIEGRIAKLYLMSNYMTMTSFGCSLMCTYCLNNRMKVLYPDWAVVRRRPVKYIIEEFKDATKQIPWIRSIDLVDDDFGNAPIEYLREFQREYRRNIGLPLDVMGLRPPDIIPEKLDVLREAGTVKVRMGIQTVNQETKSIFKRGYSNDFLMEKIKLLNQYKEAFYGIRYDFIIDTPWDIQGASLETLEFISRIPSPFIVNIFTLAFFPGTQLYSRALQEGIIRQEDVWEGRLNENFMQLKPTWVNFLLVFMNIIPLRPKLLAFLLRNSITKRIKRVPRGIFKCLQLLAFAKRWIWFVGHGDYSQIRKLLLYWSEYRFLFKGQGS